MPLVFLDESGFAFDLPRPSGYAPVGERCEGLQDWHAKGRLNVIAALLGTRLMAVTLFTGSINSNVFFAWLTQGLLPQLPPQSVIVLDNATFHKRADIQQAITEAGHFLEYLPPYSPQLNPIEHKWAQAKALRRKTRCSTEALFSLFPL